MVVVMVDLLLMQVLKRHGALSERLALLLLQPLLRLQNSPFHFLFRV